MKKYLLLVPVIVLTACASDIDKSHLETTAAYYEASVSSSEVSMPTLACSGSSVSSSSGSSVSSSVAPEPAPSVRTVLVDQSYAGVSSVKGLAWLKAIGAKKISGFSPSASLEITLSRNGNDKGFDALGLYLARLDSNGQPLPGLEWRRVRYIDAVPMRNTRAISPKSRLTTLGVDSITISYDLNALITMEECDYTKAPAFCPDKLEEHQILKDLLNNDFFIGFLPSRTTAHVKVTLIHDGGITVSPAVK